MPTDFEGPLEFSEDNDEIGFNPLRFDLLSLSPVPGYVVIADAAGNPIWAHPSVVATIGVTGPTGPIGPPGQQGDQGPEGLRGFPGRDGTNGSNGATGATGPQGERGPPGMQGDTGPEGPLGPRGATGDTGATGATGAAGLVGPWPDLYPSSPNAMDDEFDDTTGSSGPNNGLASKWTLRGANAPTITYPTDSWAKFVANTTTFGYDQAKPAAQDYTAEIRYSLGGAINDSNSFGGLYLIDAVNGDLYTIYLLIGNSSTRCFDLEVSTWGASATFFGGAFTNLKALTSVPPPTNLRIQYTNSSTAIAFEVSWDGGLNWVNVWSVGADSIGHTHVGFFKTYDPDSTNQRTMGIDWFRRTA